MFNEMFIAMLQWCEDKKTLWGVDDDKYWDGVSKMMNKLSLKCPEYSKVITEYILALDVEFKNYKPSFTCKYCNSHVEEIKQKPPHVGSYCKSCGKFQKWIKQ